MFPIREALIPHPAIANLPAAMLRLAPMLARLALPAERDATCATCPVAAGDGQECTYEKPFRADLKCCTYQPVLPNFLVGRALARGGAGAALLMGQIKGPGRVHPYGLLRPLGWERRYRQRAPRGFGRDPSMRCPFAQGEQLTCAIWPDRGAMCRTWFCRHEDGLRGASLWAAMESLLSYLEYSLARRCIAALDPPPEGAAPDDMARWFQRCHTQVDGLPPLPEGAPPDDPLPALIRDVQACLTRHGQPPPDLLGVSVQAFTRGPRGVRLVGYSRLDPRWLRTDIFQLLARLDGQTPWREALRAANENLGAEPPFSAALVEDLWRVGILREPEDWQPGAGVTLGRLIIGGEDLLLRPTALESVPWVMGPEEK